MLVKKFISGLLIASLLPMVSAHAAGDEDEKYKDFEKKFPVVGGGTLRISYEYFGEPVVAPASLSIYVTCKKNGEEIHVTTIPMCEIEKYDYEKPVKVFTVDYIYGRVDAGGQVHCDQKDQKKFEIAKICRGKK